MSVWSNLTLFRWNQTRPKLKSSKKLKKLDHECYGLTNWVHDNTENPYSMANTNHKENLKNPRARVWRKNHWCKSLQIGCNMPTKTYTFIPYRLQDHYILSWCKKVFFSLCQRRTREFWRPRKTIYFGRYGMCLFNILFLGELGTCLQNSISTRGVEHWEKNHFLQGGMLKFSLTMAILWQ
jgi:hypothetical protein